MGPGSIQTGLTRVGLGCLCCPPDAGQTLPVPQGWSISTQEVSVGTGRSTAKVRADPLWNPHNRAGRAAWEVMSFLSHKHWHEQKLEGPWREGQREMLTRARAGIHKVLLRPLLT